MAKLGFGKLKRNLHDKIPKDFNRSKEGDIGTSKENKGVITCLSTNSAIQIFYYLMSVDGHIDAEEEESFKIIAAELDPDCMCNVEENIKVCRKQLEHVVDKEAFYEIMQEGVDRAISNSVKTKDSFITPKLLVWDMLSVAFSDGDYDDSERELIKHVVFRLNINLAVFLELERSMYTLVDLEKELKWIKTTNRPYLTVETMVNEIEDRKNVIFESVKDLIAL